ncbi:MAG: RluA family pseudouridine synthase [Kiritimatiellae bacterium]|nr:RluA family pseudouridine synthase [Kiritimatiellia bacterium]
MRESQKGPRAPKFAANVEVLVVNRPDAGKSLQDFLAARLGLSRRAAKAVIDGRSVWVNRRCTWIAHHTLKIGDAVEIPRAVVSAARRQAGSAKTEIAPETRKHVRVLITTPDYVVVDKPAGLVSNEDAKSVEAILREQLKEPNLQAVHRLDRDTTGCLLFAKTYAAYLAAVEVFKTRRVKKAYCAIVAGSFPYAHQKIETPLDDQPAVSNVAREAVGPDASFLRVRIETGRTNQIRRHLAGVRFPIVGDRTFGLKSARDPRLMTVPRQMLHAASLELPDPMRKGEQIKAHSPLPADFRAALRLFGMGKK